MEGIERKDNFEVVNQLFEEAENNVLSSSAMWMRYNYFSNQIAKMLEQGYSESDINWDIINNKLYKDVRTYDNNVYNAVHSIKELEEAREQCLEAQLFNLTWRKGICKDCHKEFTLSYSEVSFYEDKGLNIPKRCSCCRSKRKGDIKK